MKRKEGKTEKKELKGKASTGIIEDDNGTREETEFRPSRGRILKSRDMTGADEIAEDRRRERWGDKWINESPHVAQVAPSSSCPAPPFLSSTRLGADDRCTLSSITP